MTLYSTQVGESGPRIVFLHGLFGQGKNFTQIAKALLPDAQSLLVDLPNHGRSPWTDRVDYVEMADAVAEVLGEWGPAHVVGHSMGGKVAMVLALRHPDLVDRLVIVDIAPSDSVDEDGDGAGEFEHLLGSLAAVDLATVHRRSDADDQLKEPIPNTTVRSFLLQNLRAGGSLDDSGYTWQANLDLLRRDLPAIGAFPHLDAVFDHPVLWVAGDRSDYIQEKHRAEMERLFPATRLVTIKGSGHWVHSEQPVAFVSALRVFLQL